jgi:hypothetical protein
MYWNYVERDCYEIKPRVGEAKNAYQHEIKNYVECIRVDTIYERV